MTFRLTLLGLFGAGSTLALSGVVVVCLGSGSAALVSGVAAVPASWTAGSTRAGGVTALRLSALGGGVRLVVGGVELLVTPHQMRPRITKTNPTARTIFAGDSL